MNYRNCIAVSACLLFTGCATITKDANQSVQIETWSKDQQRLTGAKCVAKNDRSSAETTSPGTLSIHRSSENLNVTCEKDGHPQGNAIAISRLNGGMFGNIIFGGGVGAIIDHNKGTAYTYPSWLRVVMGETLTYDRSDEKDDSQPTPAKKPETATKAP